MRRKWWSHRQAYSPPTWPLFVAAPALAVVILVLDVSWWVAALAGIAVGFTVAQLTWTLWRRRHPVLSVHELIDRQRRAAPWN